MTEKLEKTIKEEIAQLPQELQEAIKTVDWIKIAEEIGKKHNFNEDDINNLQLETLLVLISATDPEFYAINIENQVVTTKEEAQKIAKEIEAKIFMPIYNALPEKAKIEAHEVVERFPEKADRHLGGLPIDLQEKIVDVKYQNALYEIGDENNLTVAQMGLLEECIDNVILGVTAPDKFEESVEKRLGLPEKRVRLLVSQINEKILKQIRKKMMGGDEREEIAGKEKEILADHGIQILEAGEKPLPLKSNPTPNPILLNKLTQPVQNPPKTTEHIEIPAELKTPELPSPLETPEIKASAPENLPISYNDNGDPYRLPAE